MRRSPKAYSRTPGAGFPPTKQDGFVRTFVAKNLPYKLSCKGVTLVELVMAMVILGVVALPMGSMIGAQIKGMMESTDFTAAGNVARREMERLSNTAYASLATGSSVIGSYTVSWTVDTVAGGGGAERKDITLTANRTGGTVLVTLYSSIAKDVAYAP